MGAMPLQYTTRSTSQELVKQSITGSLGAMPLRYTTRSTSRELVNGVILEIWERGPFSKLRVVLVKN
jgi:hypothetical protein